MNKNKLRFIDGSLPKPDSFDPLFEAWERCNNQVHTWIMNSASSNIAQSILYIESTVVAWNKLKDRFSQADFVRIADLQLEVYLFKQDSSSATDFFTNLTILWEELESLCPIPQCTCPVRCTCELSRYVEKSKEHDFLMRFLTGLNESFSACKSQILMMDPLPSIDRAFSMVIQYERQNHLAPDDNEGEVIVNAVDGKKTNAKGKGNWPQKQCTFCNKLGHTVETCYQKHGYPIGWKKDFKSKVNAAESSENKSENGDPPPQISQEDYKQLVELLKKVQVQPSTEPKVDHSVNQIHITRDAEGISHSCVHSVSSMAPWIIDSGATDHICNDLKFFKSYYKIKPIGVRLLNGYPVIASIASTVSFSSHFILQDVLYLPDFNFNLISISKVVSSNKCRVTFTDQGCVIQDHSLKRTGLGRLEQGLYHLDYGAGKAEPTAGSVSVNSVNNDVCFSIPKSAIWHFRFGHASPAKLEMLCKDFPSIHVNKGLVCDVCHFARQKKLPFSLSNSRAEHAFDLIHLDVWGPCSLPSIHGYKFF